MLIAGIVLLALGTGSLGVSSYMEWKLREPAWSVVIKLSTGLLAIGAILFASALALGME